MAGVTGVTRCSDNKELGLQTYPNWGFGVERLFAALTNPDPPSENANAARASGADSDLSKDGPIPVSGSYRATQQGGRVMDAFVKRCEHCNEPVPETKRGRPQRFCSDRCRQAHRKIALRTRKWT